jgi:hypothetical protein
MHKSGMARVNTNIVSTTPLNIPFFRAIKRGRERCRENRFTRAQVCFVTPFKPQNWKKSKIFRLISSICKRTPMASSNSFCAIQTLRRMRSV